MRKFTHCALLAAMSMAAVGLAQPPGISPPPLDNQRIDQQTPEDGTLERTQRREAGFRGTDNVGGQDAQSDAQQELVNYLAAKLYLSNQCQIKLADMAANQAQSQEVKDLAQGIKQSHQQANQKLLRAMPQLEAIEKFSVSSNNATRSSNNASNDFGPADRSNTPPRNNVQPNLRNNRPAVNEGDTRSLSSNSQDPVDGAAQQLLNIERRAIEKNHELTKQMISDKQGQQFDMCYVGAVIGSHNWMHSELNAIQDVGAPQFTQIVDEADNKVQQHLGTAKELAKKMQDKQSSSQSNSNSRGSLDLRDGARN